MDMLKTTLTTILALVCIVYSDNIGLIILAIDISLGRQSDILMQEDENKKRHPAQYESSYQNSAEKGYNTIKHEC